MSIKSGKFRVILRIVMLGLATIVSLSIGAAILFWLLFGPPWRINTLPPDEELIAWFQTNRGDIEELVRRYRAYVPPEGVDHHEWTKLGDTPELLKRAGVQRLNEILPLWLPDPYSREARQLDGDRVTDWRERPKYQALAIQPSDKRWRQGRVWKDIVFIPAVPRIEDGILLGPVDSRGESVHSMRVLPTLNNEPPNVKRDECAVRQVEPQWFVRMCRVIY